MQTDNSNITRNRLAWQCRRGMRELDVLLLGFLEQRYPQLGTGDIDSFTRLLEYPDNVLLEWLLGHMVPSDRDVAHIVQEIRHAAVS
jgi:antitoxin CptB